MTNADQGASVEARMPTARIGAYKWLTQDFCLIRKKATFNYYMDKRGRVP
jgi:hypothetical protein